MSHTPGPWKPLRGIDDDQTRWIVVAAGADREYLIATIENGQPSDCLDAEAATASLVAAAPEMLSALKGLIEYSVCSVNDVDIWDAARAAIEKAEASEARKGQTESPI